MVEFLSGLESIILQRRNAHPNETFLKWKDQEIAWGDFVDHIYAMAAGLTSTTDYAKEYKRGSWIERDGSPEEVAEALLSELETEFAKIEIPRRNGNGG